MGFWGFVDNHPIATIILFFIMCHAIAAWIKAFRRTKDDK